MIQQFTELGEYFLKRDGVLDELTQFAQDPAFKVRSNTVLVLVFNEAGFQEVRIEEYEGSHRLWYLYRAGPANGCDATSTTRMPTWKADKPGDAEDAILKRLKRLSKSAGEALAGAKKIPDWENQALRAFQGVASKEVVAAILEKHSDPKGQATLTAAWLMSDGDLRRVGDFSAYQENLRSRGRESSSTKKTTGEIKGEGTCCVCGRSGIEVSGLSQIPNFNFYTLDKLGSVSGGFDRKMAWRNYPVCKPCSEQAGYSGEQVKKELSFNYYGGFKYLVLPCSISSKSSEPFEFLGRLTSARLEPRAVKRLTDAEDELFYVISEERDLLQVDLLFYEPDPKSFRPALYVSGLLPSRFRMLFAAKAKVDDHPWLRSLFANGEFTFRALRDVFPSASRRGVFDDDFLSATRTALELRPFPAARLLKVGMRWVQEDFDPKQAGSRSLVALFRALLFFEVLTGETSRRRSSAVQIDYGNSDQADRVRETFSESSGKLVESAASQAAFLIGACCRRVEHIQFRIRKATPFVSKYKGLRLTQADLQRLFVDAQAKAMDYGPDEELKVRGLLACAAAALSSTGERWDLSPDEISYFFALGRALSGRLAKGDEDAPETEGGVR